jgi:glyoxylate reductase/D-3-phosphoglycerate dehydrogenase
MSEVRIPKPLIVYAPLHATEIRAIAERYCPTGFDLEFVPSDGLSDALQRADYLMGFIDRVSDEALKGATRLKLVQLMSAGYDAFNVAGADAAGLPVAVNGGANAIGVAEHAIALILDTLKHVSEFSREVHAGGWRRGNLGDFKIYELWHSTVGIVGMGNIGQQVAQRLLGWQARIVYYDPVSLSPDRDRELATTCLSLDELLAESDVVSVHVPLDAATRHLIGSHALSLMKPTAVLVNTSRGDVVDEVALAAALQSGKIAGAGLDVLAQEPPRRDCPLLGIPNAILTPHVAGPTWQSWPRRFANCFANIMRVEGGEQPKWIVSD